LDEERRLAAEQHDLGARNTRGPRTRTLRPRQHRAVRLRRIGCRQHERLRLVTVLRAELTQPLDRAAERELRAAEALDEVASPAQTRSQSAGSATASSSPVAASRSYQKSAPVASASRIAACASSSGAGAPGGCPSTGASSRKKTATRSRPAPTHTSSPDAH